MSEVVLEKVLVEWATGNATPSPESYAGESVSLCA